MARVRNTFWKKQLDKLVQSDNIPVVFKEYINFNTTGGESGYGFRDNAGTIQFKNSGGSWANLGSGGSGSGDMLASTYDPANKAEQVLTVSDATDFAPALGADDNYVTDAEKTKLSNLSGTNTGDQDLSGYLTTATAASTYEPIKGVDDNYVTDAEKTKLGHISVTQAVNLDTMESDISSKISADEALYYAIAF